MNNNPDPGTNPASSTTDLAAQAQHFVLDLFNQKNDPRLVFHTYRQTMEVARAVNSLSQAEGLPEAAWEATELAAWFTNVGHLFEYQNPAPKNLELAQKFFGAQDIPPEKKEAVLAILREVFSPGEPKSSAAQLLSDSIKAVHFGENFVANSPLLRLERELILNQMYTKGEWNEFQLQQLLNARFFTSHAKIGFAPIVGSHIVRLKERVEKWQRQQAPAVVASALDSNKKFQSLEDRLSPGTQTFFRTNYRNHINLSAIADGKANIMITVNAILISLIISAISYRNMTETNPAILMPVIIFLVTGLTSLIFAVLAARPKVTSIVQEGTSIEEARRNITFFGNFVSLKLDKYEELMDEVFQDSELLYGNMTRDLYYLGKVLDKKYRYLSVSYTIFMVGFVATVVLFLIVLLSG